MNKIGNNLNQKKTQAAYYFSILSFHWLWRFSDYSICWNRVL